MNYFVKVNKNLLKFSLVVLILVPTFGIKFLLTFLGNVLLLLFLIPVLLLLLAFIGFNFYKSKINICSNCGAISQGLNETCLSCGADLKGINKNNKINVKPSESTIEIKAEEIK